MSLLSKLENSYTSNQPGFRENSYTGNQPGLAGNDFTQGNNAMTPNPFDPYNILGSACNGTAKMVNPGAGIPEGCASVTAMQEARGYQETYKLTVPAGSSVPLEFKPAKAFAVTDIVVTDSTGAQATDVFLETVVIGSQTQSPQGQGQARIPAAMFAPLANRPCLRLATASTNKALTSRVHNDGAQSVDVYVTLVGVAFDSPTY